MKTIFFVSLTIFLFILLPKTSFAATYYVSPSGSATWANCANINTPCAVQAAFNNAVAGDTVYFRGGTYNVPQKNNVNTYHGYYEPANSGTAGSPIIFAAYPNETPVFNGTAGGSGDNPEYATIFGTAEKDYITFDGFTLQSDSGTRMARVFIGSDMGGTSDYITFKNCTLNGGSSVLSSTDNREGIRIEHASYVTIQNNKIFNYRQADNWHNTGGTKSYHVDHVTYENNEIYNCSVGIFDKSGGDFNIYRYNYIHDVGAGIEASTNVSFQTNGQMYHNLIANFTGFGATVYGESDAIDNWQIYNNTFYTAAVAMEGCYVSRNSVTGSNFSIYNNIFQGRGSDYNGANVRLGTIGLTQFDYNNYSQYMNVLCSGGTYTSLASLKTASCNGLASGNHDQHSLASAAVFTNSSGAFNQKNDFILSASSPGHNSGNDGKDIGADISLVGIQGSQTPDTTPPAVPTGVAVI